MSWRRKIAEYEADLYQVPIPKLFKFPKGEAEYKAYDDGERKFEISLWSLKIQDGSAVSIRLNGAEMFDLQIHGGRGKQELFSNEISNLTEVHNGDVLEVCHNGKILLQGTFRPDD
jgi:hypothetical protein